MDNPRAELNRMGESDMRDFAKVAPTFWTGETGRKIKQMGPDVQLVGLYLVTNPHTTPLGIYYLPLAYMDQDLALSREAIKQALALLYEAQFSIYDTETEVIWVYEMAKYQIGQMLRPKDHKVQWVNKLFSALPKSNLLRDFYTKYSKAYHIRDGRFRKGNLGASCQGASKGLTKPLLEGLSKGPTLEMEMEMEMERDIETSLCSTFDNANDTNEEKKPKYEANSVPMQLANLLISEIRKNKPDYKTPSDAILQHWATEIDRMMRIDKRQQGRIKEVIVWCQANSFWARNILSGGKLREKFDRLEMDMQMPKSRRTQDQGSSDWTEADLKRA